MKNIWKNPDYISKQIKLRDFKQNKLELFFESWLDENFPNTWKYVGDGQFIISTKCPDFVSINGKKQIIELYGNYWHKDDNPQDRIDLFSKYGYKTLIIWEREIKNLNLVKEKIEKEFYQ